MIVRYQHRWAAENRVQRLCQSHRLALGLARQVQVAAVQSVALYRADIWWQGQKDRLTGIQLMINRPARAITGMLKTICMARTRGSLEDPKDL